MKRSTVIDRYGLWCARLAWLVLPLTLGSALARALEDWSTQPARVAAVLAWASWFAALVALFAPRPWGVTLLRIAAPAAVLAAVATAVAAPVGLALLAIVSTSVAAAFALSRHVALPAAAALAYGDEARYPLRIPLPMLVAPVPVAVVTVIAVAAAGPLLLADGRVALGAVVLAVGVPIAALLVRSLHALATRLLIFVPAGVVVVDPTLLSDPVLVRREQIRTFTPARVGKVGPDALDLRLGTVAGTVVLALGEPVSFGRRQGRAAATMIPTTLLVLAVVAPAAAARTAAARRIPVAAQLDANPPPSSTSPS